MKVITFRDLLKAIKEGPHSTDDWSKAGNCNLFMTFSEVTLKVCCSNTQTFIILLVICFGSKVSCMKAKIMNFCPFFFWPGMNFFLSMIYVVMQEKYNKYCGSIEDEINMFLLHLCSILAIFDMVVDYLR